MEQGRVMSVTRDQAEMLATLALACRPHDAPRWDRGGLIAAIGRVKGRSLASVAIAVMQAAEDHGAETPAVIPAEGPHWRQPTPSDRPTARPPKPHEACRACGRHLHAPDAICDSPTRRPAPPSDPTPGLEQARHLVSVTRQGLCSHGVAPENCIDHRARSEATTEESQ
jgi:hypothetical protein